MKKAGKKEKEEVQYVENENDPDTPYQQLQQ